MKKLLPDPELEALIRKLNSSAQHVAEETEDASPSEGAASGSTRPSRWPLPAKVEERDPHPI